MSLSRNIDLYLEGIVISFFKKYGFWLTGAASYSFKTLPIAPSPKISSNLDMNFGSPNDSYAKFLKTNFTLGENFDLYYQNFSSAHSLNNFLEPHLEEQFLTTVFFSNL